MKPKYFSAQVLESCILSVMDLKGYSHCGPSKKRYTTHYPFTSDERAVYFKAENRTKACRALDRLMAGARDVAECLPKNPHEIVSENRRLAIEICQQETFAGNYSRFELFKTICHPS